MKLQITFALALIAGMAIAQEKSSEEVARVLPQSSQTPEQIVDAAITPEQIAEAEARINEVKEWIKDFLVRHAPPGRKLWYPDAQETEEEARARYDGVASDVVFTAFQSSTKTPFMQRESGRSRLVAVWLGVMLHESGFMKNVDFNLGKYGRGDQGLSWCLMQLRIGTGKTQKWNVAKNRRPYWGDSEDEMHPGYTGQELIADRKLCLSEGHKLVWASFKSCEDRPLEDRLTAYAVGFCKDQKDDPVKQKKLEDGLIKSRIRMRSGVGWYEQVRYQRTWKDADIMKAVELLTQAQKQVRTAQIFLIPVPNKPVTVPNSLVAQVP
jgi:hypothetical protein